MWAALDWPIGKLGAGYLASAHTIEFLLLTLLAGSGAAPQRAGRGVGRVLRRRDRGVTGCSAGWPGRSADC